MPKNIIIAAVVGIVVLGLGAILLAQNRTTNQNRQITELPQIIQQANVLPVVVNLAAQNNSGEKGTATLTALEKGKTKVVLNLTGAPQNVAQPAHIHNGSCANIGDVLYPLTSPVNEVSETTLDVDLTEDILNKTPLSINVHKSPEEVNVFYSCGDIGAPASGFGAGSAQGGQFQTPDDKRGDANKPED